MTTHSISTLPSSPPDPTQTTLPHLPHDLHHLIIFFLAKHKAALASCCRVSKDFQSLATLPLYASLELNLLPYENHPTPLIPSFDLSVASLSNTTHLTIHPHTRDLCQHLSPTLPNLITLRLMSNPGLDFCRPPHDRSDPTCRATYAIHCPMLNNLRPRRIVAHLTPAWTMGAHGVLSDRKPFPPVSLEEFVIIIHPEVLFFPSVGRKDYSLGDVVKGEEHELTLVLQSGGSKWLELKQLSKHPWAYGVLSARERSEVLARRMCKSVARVCDAEAGGWTVVGIEFADLGEEELGLTVAERMEEVRAQLKKRLVKKGWDGVKAEARAAEINFVAVVDYKGQVE